MDTLKSHYNELLNFVRKLSPEALQAAVSSKEYVRRSRRSKERTRIGMQSGGSSCRTKLLTQMLAV